jgi:hypothetical protein
VLSYTGHKSRESYISAKPVKLKSGDILSSVSIRKVRQKFDVGRTLKLKKMIKNRNSQDTLIVHMLLNMIT